MSHSSPGIGWEMKQCPMPISGFLVPLQQWVRVARQYRHVVTDYRDVVTDYMSLYPSVMIAHHNPLGVYAPGDGNMQTQWHDPWLLPFARFKWRGWLMVHPTENKRRERNVFQAARFWRWRPSAQRFELPTVLVTCIATFYTRGISHRTPATRK